jgi:hypothetical protein
VQAVDRCRGLLVSTCIDWSFHARSAAKDRL